MLRTAQLLPLTRAFDTALRRRAFPPGAGSLLPGPLAATRTGLTPAGNDELPTESDHVITQPLPNCRAYSRVSSNLRWRSAARDPRAGRFHIPSCPPVKTASRDGRRAPMPRSPLLGYQRARRAKKSSKNHVRKANTSVTRCKTASSATASSSPPANWIKKPSQPRGPTVRRRDRRSTVDRA
jgi:hypothetical protein